ncbi:hypothetical protein WME73_05880 [Sorangium sp. So ce302]|uniref:hypothetical protein n=1 Tax=Sorangium sp. So ce302 TaxID=3133297 RepID=UPI003F645155
MAVGSLALLVQSACGGAVIMDGGGGGAGGAGSTTGQGSTSGQGSPDGPDGPISTTSSVAPSPTTSGGGGRRVSAIVFGDSSSVTLRVATLALSCSDPDANPTYEPCSDWWDLELRMPESMLAVGEVDTASGDLTIFGTSSRADCSSTGAVSGGGDAGFGRLTITAIDARSVSFELSDVGPVFVDDDPNGRYVAVRCAAR